MNKSLISRELSSVCLNYIVSHSGYGKKNHPQLMEMHKKGVCLWLILRLYKCAGCFLDLWVCCIASLRVFGWRVRCSRHIWRSYSNKFVTPTQEKKIVTLTQGKKHCNKIVTHKGKKAFRFNCNTNTGGKAFQQNYT